MFNYQKTSFLRLMGYDDDFFVLYSEYLEEKVVRKQHGWIFNIALLNPDFRSVVDFGCGRHNEFFVYAKPKKYIGIDKEAEPFEQKGKQLIRADYLACEDLKELINPHSPTAFVSLFSTENMMPVEQSYELYHNIFDQLPSVQSGLVAGFFYAGKIDQNPVGETGGILSHQTLEHITEVQSDLFSEKRIILPVPSEMFGSDVYEVWKFFDRS